MSSLEESSSSSSSSAEIIASSDDLLSEILRRLPVKSLLKFKSVSKHWRSLITDPLFSRRKIHNLKPPSALFLQDESSILSIVPLDPSNSHATAPFAPLTFFADNPHGMEIKNSCNGLFCCYSSDESSDESSDLNDTPLTFYVCNPTTKQFRTLPPLHSADKPVWGMTLAFDPSESHLYKVICVQLVKFPDPSIPIPINILIQIQIYSPETGSWTLCGDPFEPPPAIGFSGGVYCNGAVHWVCHKGTIALYFDVKEEGIREMPMPPGPGQFDERGVRYFGETLGHLHLVENNIFSATDFNVYEMKRDRSGWLLKFRVNLDAVALTLPEFIDEGQYFNCPFDIVCVVRGVKDEDSFLVVHVPGKIIAYNFNSKSHCKMCDVDFWFHGDRCIRFRWEYAFQFIESLSLV